MKLLYTITNFEFTLTKNGHFGFTCLRTEMVLVDYLHIKWISLIRLGEAGADPTYHNIQCLMLREKGKGLIGKGGGVSDKIELELKFIQKRNCRVQEILKLS